MISINEAKRLVKRALLANLATDKRDLAITPLVSGRHGIGKSQMVKSIAKDLGGVCITIEGGTLKEGEITDYGQWPFQCSDKAFLLVKVNENADFIARTHLGRHVGLRHKDTAQFTTVEVSAVVCKALDDKSVVVSETDHCLWILKREGKGNLALSGNIIRFQNECRRSFRQRDECNGLSRPRVPCRG